IGGLLKRSEARAVGEDLALEDLDDLEGAEAARRHGAGREFPLDAPFRRGPHRESILLERAHLLGWPRAEPERTGLRVVGEDGGEGEGLGDLGHVLEHAAAASLQGGVEIEGADDEAGRRRLGLAGNEEEAEQDGNSTHLGPSYSGPPWKGIAGCRGGFPRSLASSATLPANSRPTEPSTALRRWPSTPCSRFFPSSSAWSPWPAF